MHHAGSENPEAWKPNAGDFKCSGVNLDGPLMKILDLAFLKDEFFQNQDLATLVGLNHRVNNERHKLMNVQYRLDNFSKRTKSCFDVKKKEIYQNSFSLRGSPEIGEIDKALLDMIAEDRREVIRRPEMGMPHSNVTTKIFGVNREREMGSGCGSWTNTFPNHNLVTQRSVSPKGNSSFAPQLPNTKLASSGRTAMTELKDLRGIHNMSMPHLDQVHNAFRRQDKDTEPLNSTQDFGQSNSLTFKQLQQGIQHDNSPEQSGLVTKPLTKNFYMTNSKVFAAQKQGKTNENSSSLIEGGISNMLGSDSSMDQKNYSNFYDQTKSLASEYYLSSGLDQKCDLFSPRKPRQIPKRMFQKMKLTKNYTNQDGAPPSYIYENKKIQKLLTKTSTAKLGSSSHIPGQVHKSPSQTQNMRNHKLQLKELDF